MYVLMVIAVYLLIIFPNVIKKSEPKKEEKQKETENKVDTKSGTGLSENVDKNGISQGASGQQKYRIGYTN